jgi:glucose 1-dehydrogenase
MVATLAGRRALVTGASSGIGRAVAHAFAEAGAKVVVNHAPGQEEAARAVVGEIEAAGGAALALSGDVSDPREVDRLFGRTVEAFGGLDLLVANAGIQRDAPVAELSEAAWRAVLDVDLSGAFFCAQAAVRCFLAQPAADGRRSRGGVIFMSSVHQRIPWAGHVNYAAAKGGVQMMMASMAQELAPERIRVNAIAPGAIRTAINRAAWETPQAEASLLRLIPYGRVGEPQDVARAAVWLASDDSDYVVGTTLTVDGGMSLFPAFAHGG